MKPLHQPSLFDDALPDDASALVTVPKGKERLSRAQSAFNRLTERIRQVRETLAAWEAFVPRLHARVEGELRPAEEHIRAAQRRLVTQLDTLLAATKSGERLTRRQQKKVRAVLLEIAADILEADPDPDLEALYDRHSDLPYSVERETELELAEAVLSDVLGKESIEGHDAQSVEELLRHAGDKLHKAQAEDRPAHERSGRRRKMSKGEEAKSKAVELAAKSVREIYRKLVSALHPDREADAAERARKTTLMQRANRAFERNDLLELLTLQIEIEQIDAAELAKVPEARLQHYNDVLKEQVQVLESQLREKTMPFCLEFDLEWPVVPQRVDQALSGKIVEAHMLRARMERTCERLADPKQRRMAIDELPAAEDDEPSLSDLAVLAAAFGDGPKRTAHSARARSRKAQRRKA